MGALIIVAVWVIMGSAIAVYVIWSKDDHETDFDVFGDSREQ